jgi:hypothetical protein
MEIPDAMTLSPDALQQYCYPVHIWPVEDEVQIFRFTFDKIIHVLPELILSAKY